MVAMPLWQWHHYDSDTIMTVTPLWQWHNYDSDTIMTMTVVKYLSYCSFKSLRPRQDGRHFADDIFKCIFLSENFWI